jgi:type IV secretion system protein VirD4
MEPNKKQDLKHGAMFIAMLSVVGFIVYSYQYEPINTPERLDSIARNVDPEVRFQYEQQQNQPLSYADGMMLGIFTFFLLGGLLVGYYYAIRSLSAMFDGYQWPKLAFFALLMVVAFWGGMAVNSFFLPIMGFVGFLVVSVMTNGTWQSTITDIRAKEKSDRQKQEIFEAYGVKGWADSDRIARVLKGGNEGVYIGGNFHFNQQGNILTVGGPRGGKGVNLILNALLDIRLTKPEAQSWVILDPKGENCAVSADYLKWAGYNVHVINPFGIPEIKKFGNARFNVFDLFNAGTPEFASFVDMVITSLIPDSKKGDDFFVPAGRDLIRFYIGYMMTHNEEPKTFITLYNWLHLTGKDRHDLLLKMSQYTGLQGVVRAGAMGIIGLLDDDAGKTVGNIYKTATQAISVFGDSLLRDSVNGSDFALSNIAKEKTAVFICVNPNELNRTQAWLRILFNSFIDNMIRNYSKGRKVVFLMDEFHKLGSLKVVKDNISYLPGYNVTIWPIVQSLGQLKDLYPDIWEDFVGSSTVRHYLSIQDNFSAEYISKRMPQIIKFVGSHADGSPKEIRIPLLSQDEIIGFENIILEINGLDRPAQLRRKPYWEINEHGAPNPFR